MWQHLMTADILSFLLVVWFLGEKPCGGKHCSALTDSERRKPRLLRQITHHYMPLLTRVIQMYWCVHIWNKDLNIERTSGCNCHHQYRIRAKIMFERSVLNIQPTPSAIFSRMLECGSECFLLSVFMLLCGCVCSHRAPYLKSCTLWLPPWVGSVKSYHCSPSLWLCKSDISAVFWETLLCFMGVSKNNISMIYDQ